MIYRKAALSSLQEVEAVSFNRRRKKPENIFFLSLLHPGSLQSSVDCTVWPGGHRGIPVPGHTWSWWSPCIFLLFLSLVITLYIPVISGLGDHPAHSCYFWAWGSSCFVQAGADDLQMFLQQTQLDSLGLAAQGYKISLDGIICEQGTLQSLRCLNELLKRLSWEPWNPQEFILVHVCLGILLGVQI